MVRTNFSSGGVRSQTLSTLNNKQRSTSKTQDEKHDSGRVVSGTYAIEKPKAASSMLLKKPKTTAATTTMTHMGSLQMNDDS